MYELILVTYYILAYVSLPFFCKIFEIINHVLFVAGQANLDKMFVMLFYSIYSTRCILFLVYIFSHLNFT